MALLAGTLTLPACFEVAGVDDGPDAGQQKPGQTEHPDGSSDSHESTTVDGGMALDAGAPDTQVDGALPVAGDGDGDPESDAGHDTPMLDEGHYDLSVPGGSLQIGLTNAEHQAGFAPRIAAGEMPVDVAGYEQHGVDRYAVIWAKNPGITWEARHALSSAALQSETVRLQGLGFHPVVVRGYEVSGVTWYTAIFIQESADWEMRHDLSPAEYQATFTELTGEGYRLRHVSGYTVGGAERYAGIWERSGGPAWAAVHNLTEAQYETRAQELALDGYQPVLVDAFAVQGQVKMAALFEQSSAPASIATRGLDVKAFVAELDERRLQGFRPRFVRPYRDGDQVRVAAVLGHLALTGEELGCIDRTVEGAMAAQQTPGLSLAISHQGKLAFAKAFGVASRADAQKLRTSHRMRLASVAKPLTAIAAMQLVEAHELSLDSKVLGSGGILGEDYAKDAELRDPRVRDITVRHLLEHSLGGFDNDPGDGTPDPMFDDLTLGTSELIGRVLREGMLEAAPGVRFQYSNFGYLLLGRVIAKVSGMSYAEYMASHVFEPSGATSFALAGSTLAERLPGEVAYHVGQAAPSAQAAPYRIAVQRLEAAGGWLATPVDLLRVLLRSDGFAAPADTLLSAPSIAEMTRETDARTESGENPHYARGWLVNSLGTWWPTGYLDGSQALVVRTADRYGPSKAEAFVWTAMVNGTHGGADLDLDTLLWQAVGCVSSWPDYDLF